jgi:DNA polymerase III subunit delta'
MTVLSHQWGIIGHAWAVDFLQRSIAAGRGAHAYLISGTAEPCLTCRSCRRIERSNHPDVRIAGMASQGASLKPDEAARQRDLKIDTVRQWQADINLKPFEGQHRVLILHDAERLTEAAANAMLKTLEEPPPYATLVLVANTAGDLLPTIVSRCQPIKLRPVPRAAVTAALVERLNLLPEDAALLAAWSGGRPGWAIRMVQAPEEIELRQQQTADLLLLPSAGRDARFRWAEERAKAYRSGEQEQVFATLALWQGLWRDVLLLAADCPEQIVNLDRRAELTHLAQQVSLRDAQEFLTRLDAAARQLRENVNPQLVFENLGLHVPA